MSIGIYARPIRRWRIPRPAMLGMLGLGIGYFIWYTPYSGLAKALSGGLLPGMTHPAGGFVLLPPMALGMLLSMPLFLLASGWWRHSRTRRFGRVTIPFPGRESGISAAWMAVIVATTTLNFTFAGFSILFMLVMMRIETILLAPSMDLVRRRKISGYSWAAIGLSLLSALIALTDVTSYRLSFGAFASLFLYLAAYTGRFDIMSRHAKTGQAGDRRFFVEEHMTTPVLLTLMLGLGALIGQGPALAALREGFTTFLTTPAAPYAILVGVCYEGLFIFTTLIFLDRREFAFCMPVHVCASLLAGVAASLILRGLFGTAAPTAAQLVAALIVVTAALTLSYPAIRDRVRVSYRRRHGVLLFVCGSNVSRSPMAEAIARAELASLPKMRWTIRSAGVSPRAVDAPLSTEAAEALRWLDITPHEHRSRRLTPDLCRDSRVVYCMTEAQRAEVLALVPDATGHTFCLDPTADVTEPEGTVDSHVRCARQLRQLVRSRLWEEVTLAGVGPRVSSGA